jgi:hypothetical protein
MVRELTVVRETKNLIMAMFSGSGENDSRVYAVKDLTLTLFMLRNTGLSIRVSNWGSILIMA